MGALVVEKVEGDIGGTGLAVVAKDGRNIRLVLFRHRLLTHFFVNELKIGGHIGHTFEAGRALIGSLTVSGVAWFVNAMTTGQKGNGGATGEHVFATDRTITLEAAFDALVIVLHADGHAHVTCFAVEEILAEALAFATNTTIITVVCRSIRLVIP